MNKKFIKTFESFKNEFDQLPNNRLFIYLKDRLKDTKFNILFFDEGDDVRYVDIISGEESSSENGISNTFFDFVEPFTVGEIRKKISRYIGGDTPKNPHSSYNEYVELSKILSSILNEWDVMSESDKSKFKLSDLEIEKLLEKPNVEELGEVLCIKDNIDWMSEETLEFNGLQPGYNILYKKGVKYKHFGEYHYEDSGESMITIQSDIKNPHSNKNNDHPKYLFQHFIVKQSDEEVERYTKQLQKMRELKKKHPDWDLDDSIVYRPRNMFSDYFKKI